MDKEVPEVMGRFGAVFGIKGYIKVFSYTEDPESLFSYKPWFYRKPGGQWQSLEILDVKPHADSYIVKIKGFEVREVVQGFTGSDIGILPSSLPKLPEGVYRWIELIGLKAVTLDGYDLGVVSNMMETGANDVLVVKARSDDEYEIKERLIPYLPHVVKNVNLDDKVILVDWEPDF